MVPVESAGPSPEKAPLAILDMCLLGAFNTCNESGRRVRQPVASRAGCRVPVPGIGCQK